MKTITQVIGELSREQLEKFARQEYNERVGQVKDLIGTIAFVKKEILRKKLEEVELHHQNLRIYNAQTIYSRLKEELSPIGLWSDEIDTFYTQALEKGKIDNTKLYELIKELMK